MNEAFKLAPHEWALLRGMLDEALALPAIERAAWLAALSEERSAGLKPRLQALLANAAGDADPGDAARLLQTLPKIETGQFAPPPGAGEKAGDRVGPYRLIRELGSGGMGSVWLAERTDLLQGRQVALKLPHGAWKRAGLAERLAREREILATLEHPHIARLYDAGVTPEGQPWLALEYVAGERIDAYCKANNLGVKPRLQLFQQVVRAVAHAHAQLVVHRDLKPANILVKNEGEDAGDVKLLDFGIAKLVAEGVVEETELTREAGRAFTPEYASPEQILGKPLGTASDVYSLGVVLFELLADARPYRLSRDSRAALEEAVSQADVPRPSTLAPPERRRALRGDLDTIALRALKREPDERYATVAALAEDIQRHLDSRPVLAQPDSAWYRLRSFARRNRLAVGAASAVLLAVLAGAGVAVWQAAVARDEQARAEAVSQFITSVFEQASPWTGPQNKPTAGELLQRARQVLDARRGDPPLLRLELLRALGSSFAGLQEKAPAEATLREALAVADELGLPPQHPQRVKLRLHLADVYLANGQTKDLKQVLAGLVPLLEPEATRQPQELATALLREVQVANDEGRYADMETLARRAQEVAAAHLPAGHVAGLSAQLLLANALENQRKFEPARVQAQRAYELAQAHYAAQPRHPQLADTRFIYARILNGAGDWGAALPLMQQAIGDTRAVFGEHSLRVATMLRTSTAPLLSGGMLAEALAASDEALRVMTLHYAADSVHLAYAHVARGSIHAALRHADAAFADFDRAWQVLRGALGGEAHYVLHVQAQRSAAMVLQRRVKEAQRDLAWIAMRHKALGYPDPANGLLHYATALRVGGDADAALTALAEAAPSVKSPGDRFRWHYERAFAQLERGQAAPALQDFERAAALRDLRSAMTPIRAELAIGHGRALLANGQADQARAHLQAGLDFWLTHEPGSRWVREASAALARGSARSE